MSFVLRRWQFFFAILAGAAGLDFEVLPSTSGVIEVRVVIVKSEIGRRSWFRNDRSCSSHRSQLSFGRKDHRKTIRKTVKSVCEFSRMSYLTIRGRRHGVLHRSR
jgi:hypothetical protein